MPLKARTMDTSMHAWPECTYRYEKMTSIKKTNLARTVGRNGETNAGMKKRTEIVALVSFVSCFGMV